MQGLIRHAAEGGLQIALAILLLLAISPLPYDFYISLRWLVCFGSLVLSWVAYQRRHGFWLIIFLVIAAFFNPIRPVYLSRAAWLPVDLIAAALFFLSPRSKIARWFKSHSI